MIFLILIHHEEVSCLFIHYLNPFIFFRISCLNLCPELIETEVNEIFCSCKEVSIIDTVDLFWNRILQIKDHDFIWQRNLQELVLVVICTLFITLIHLFKIESLHATVGIHDEILTIDIQLQANLSIFFLFHNIFNSLRW